MKEKMVFVVSDRTGITAETLSHSLLTQFPDYVFKTQRLPFVDSLDKAQKVVEQINETALSSGSIPLVFSTFVDEKLKKVINSGIGVFFDFFDTYIGPLEKALEMESSHTAGRSHGVVDVGRYTSRISALNYSMHADDGTNVGNYDQADVILIGVSRSGKTPTCLYLALHFGIYAANYPLTERDLNAGEVPAAFESHRDKIFGLTISPGRLQQIRKERRGGNEQYAQLRQCRIEVNQAEAIFRREKIDFIDVTNMSIEEIGATILDKKNLQRGMY